ncbi:MULTISPECIES: lysylphosphatidylglycerol synthase transmembrane domain-containing protein [Halorussus]|uniref:lysylphosphatidylglycerol synthase transmembrane domain-containing protein n=1 Tax=Halorussus TaxID=1070314 RepID=UPI000E213CB3|nr:MULTISPECIES: lysylphosphatidylglycerol synthase transmembrane domain-containing protein [Halorussus]NHN60656.1 flippase-like domain-containing protein [Halorussus sp. JP-T4]
MNGAQLRTTIIGFLGTFAVLGLLLYFVGIEEFVRELRRADGETVALMVLVTLGWLGAWGFGLRTVLDVLGVDVSFVKSFFILNGAMFSNNITPFGQAGGEPVTALLISKVADTEYERGLAAIASVDSLNFVPSIVLALGGAGFYATQTTFGRRLRLATAAIVVLSVAVPFAGFFGWRNRGRLRRAIARVLAPVLRFVTRVAPVDVSLSRETLETRVGEFFDSIERVATNRRGLTLALAASTAGWVCQMVALWLAFAAIGSPIPFPVLLFVVPVGAIAGVTPLPGGAGGIEAVLVGLLSSLPGIGIGWETALAAVIIFRGAIYWVPIAIGGGVVSLVGVDSV